MTFEIKSFFFPFIHYNEFHYIYSEECRIQLSEHVIHFIFTHARYCSNLTLFITLMLRTFLNHSFCLFLPAFLSYMMLDTKYWPFLCRLPLKGPAQHALSSAGPMKKYVGDGIEFSAYMIISEVVHSDKSDWLSGKKEHDLRDKNDKTATDLPLKYVISKVMTPTLHHNQLFGEPFPCFSKTYLWSIFSVFCRIYVPTRINSLSVQRSSNAPINSK